MKSAIINSAYFYKDTQIYLLNGRGETIFLPYQEKKKTTCIFSVGLAAMNGKQSKEMDRLVEEDDT